MVTLIGGGANTINGTDDNDTITGPGGDDTLPRANPETGGAGSGARRRIDERT